MILKLIKKYKTQLGDSVWSVLGLVLMNAVAQVAAFPLLARVFGDAGYGDIQYLMAYVNIITVSVGCAANLARMTAPAKERMENNGDYNLFLIGIALLGIPFALLIRVFGGVEMGFRFFKDSQGKGYAIESASVLKGYVKEVLKAKTLKSR